jgi:ActR/RegA family two-component response regulator
LFTGWGRVEVAIKALTLGADAYINKQGDTDTVWGDLITREKTSRRTPEKPKA